MPQGAQGHVEQARVGERCLADSLDSRLKIPARTGERRLGRVFDAYRGLERVSVDRIGADLATRAIGIATDSGAGVLHVDLPTRDPAIRDAVEQLRAASFVSPPGYLAGLATLCCGCNVPARPR